MPRNSGRTGHYAVTQGKTPGNARGHNALRSACGFACFRPFNPLERNRRRPYHEGTKDTKQIGKEQEKEERGWVGRSHQVPCTFVLPPLKLFARLVVVGIVRFFRIQLRFRQRH